MKAIATFRSDVRQPFRLLGRLLLAAAVVMSAAVAAVQLQQGRFPDYPDFLGMFLILCGLSLVGVFGMGVAYAISAVHVFQEGIRCYDAQARNHFVRWTDIRSTSLRKFYGHAYLFVEWSKEKPPITIPLWLRDMDSFVTLVEREAGSANMLVAALKSARNGS